MMQDKREEAAWAVVRALRTGEISAARIARGHLAPQPVFRTARDTFEGVEAVAERLTGQWTYTPVMAMGAWDLRRDDAGILCAAADFTGIGAAPAGYRLAFAFDEQDRISAITETQQPAAPPEPLPAMSAWHRRCIDRALAEGKPVTVSHVDARGQAALSLRGSLHTIDGRRLGLWLRKPAGGLAEALRAGQTITFLYRDSATRTTLVGHATGYIVDDEAGRIRIFDGTPEVEQRHDPGRSGAAALLDLISLAGTSPSGPVSVRCDSAG
ncbi:MAG: hypothetical protein RL702_1100 [Pseudomonadota bacterium]|jgi:hypothetical protein